MISDIGVKIPPPKKKKKAVLMDSMFFGVVGGIGRKLKSPLRPEPNITALALEQRRNVVENSFAKVTDTQKLKWGKVLGIYFY